MRTDPVQLEIFLHRFRSVTEEMGYTLQRTGHTVFVNETADLGVALVSLDGEAFGYPDAIGITSFVNLDYGVALAAFDHYEPGDVVMTNDPYTSGGMASHLPDVNLLQPVFWEGELICFAFAYVHATDIGGKVAGSISPSSYEVYQEGIRVPPVKLYKAGELNREFLDLFLANCRVPEDNWGDLKAIVAALHVGEARIHELLGRYGVDAVRQAISDALEYAGRRAELALRTIPEGSYEFVEYLDSDIVSDIPVRIAVRLTVADGRLHVDFRGTDPQLPSAFNLAAMGKAHPWLVYKLTTYLKTADPQIPLNGGLFRPVSVSLPEGSVVNCRFPAAIGVRTTLGVRAQDALFGALARALPLRMPAAGAGYMAPVVLAEPRLEGGRPNVIVIEPMVGGIGARPDRDGIDARDVVDIANLRNNPVEVVEAGASVLIREYGLRQDSGGPGRFRGGLGAVLEFQTLLPGSLITARGMERHRFAPWGVQGGRPGARAQLLVRRGGQGPFVDSGKVDVLHLEPLDIVRIVTPGGGGYGDPLQRDPEAVRRDVEMGLVSPDCARRDYGVVIGDGCLDPLATAELREGLARERSEGCADAAFDFGPERRAYEAVWTKGLADALAEILYGLPVPLRPYVRQELWRAVQRAVAEGRPATAEFLADEWNELSERLARARRSPAPVLARRG